MSGGQADRLSTWKVLIRRIRLTGRMAGRKKSPGGDRRRRRTGDGEEDFIRVRVPKRNKGEIFAIAERLLGASHVNAVCEDGKLRLARIPGKMKKRMWIREGDLLIVKPWDFQDEKADVLWRYTQTQASYLQRTGKLPPDLQKF